MVVALHLFAHFLDPPTHSKTQRYRRTYFDFEKWKSHRASSRYRRHIVGLFGSRIVRALGSPLLFVVVAAVFTGQ